MSITNVQCTNKVHKEQQKIKGKDMYVMVSPVETSISLSGKIQSLPLNLLGKPLKKKDLHHLLSKQSAKIITGAVERTVPVSSF